MALTDEQLAFLRVEVGTALSENDAEDRYARLGDVTLVAHEVLAQRLADLLSGPSSYSISGVYSESNSETIRALTEKVAILATAAGLGGGVTVGRLVRGGGR